MIFAGSKTETNHVSFDPDGRPLDAKYRDTNPGLFHLALTNYLGLRHRGLVADITTTGMTLNFPVIAFEVRAMAEVKSAAELTKLKSYDASAATVVKVITDVHYADSHRVLENLPGIDQSFVITYKYALELDASGAIIGGEWLDSSEKNHPDFLWASADGTIDVPSMSTLRLGKSLVVGPAVAALLAAASDPDSKGLVDKLRQDKKNFDGYHIFDGWRVPPVPAAVKPLLSTN